MGKRIFACHDPAVIVKQSENLAAFISQLHELGKNQGVSLRYHP